MLRSLSVAALVLFGAGQAHAIHYGCVSSPDAPKTVFMYKNDGPPVDYVEQIRNADGTDLYLKPIDVVYHSSGFVSVGFDESQIDQTTTKKIRVTDKSGQLLLQIPYVDPDSYRSQDNYKVNLRKPAIFDGVETRSLVYTFCGDD